MDRKYLALNLSGYAIQKRGGDHMIWVPSVVSPNSYRPRECKGKLASNVNILKWVSKTKTN